MKIYKAFVIEQQHLEEAIVKKGAVAAYALKGRRHGNNAVSSYIYAKQELILLAKSTSNDHKIDALCRALTDLLDGLVATRQQIGSVSAQVTASTVI